MRGADTTTTDRATIAGPHATTDVHTTTNAGAMDARADSAAHAAAHARHPSAHRSWREGKGQGAGGGHRHSGRAKTQDDASVTRAG